MHINFKRTQLAGAIAAASLMIPATAFAVTTINSGPGDGQRHGHGRRQQHRRPHLV